LFNINISCCHCAWTKIVDNLSERKIFFFCFNSKTTVESVKQTENWRIGEFSIRRREKKKLRECLKKKIARLSRILVSCFHVVTSNNIKTPQLCHLSYEIYGDAFISFLHPTWYVSKGDTLNQTHISFFVIIKKNLIFFIFIGILVKKKQQAKYFNVSVDQFQ
jgi:hypothetical protein